MCKKTILMLLIMALLCALLAGCSGIAPQPSQKDGGTATPTTAVTGTNDELKKVELDVYLLSNNPPSDKDLVIEEINKILEREINTTINVETVKYTEAVEKLPLLFASGERFDICATNPKTYTDLATKGSLEELTDELLQKYAPKTYEQNPKPLWKAFEINGKIYGIPRLSPESSATYYVVRGDLRAKYNLPEIKTIDDLELFLDTIAANEEGIIPYADYVQNQAHRLVTIMVLQENQWGYIRGADCGGTQDPVYSFADNSIFQLNDTPEYLEFVKKMAEWRKKGYWSASALTAQGTPFANFVAGKSAIALCNLNQASTVYADVQVNNPEWNVEIFLAAPEGKTIETFYGLENFSIRAGSENVERSLMVIELLRNNPDLHDLINYGIRGRHWIDEGPNKYSDGPYRVNWNLGLGGAAVNANLVREPVNAFPNYQTFMEQIKERGVSYELAMFQFNNENVKAEMAALTQLDKQYRVTLNLGFADDPEQVLNEWKQKQKEAGWDKFLAEVQRQAAEYLESLK